VGAGVADDLGDRIETQARASHRVLVFIRPYKRENASLILLKLFDRPCTTGPADAAALEAAFLDRIGKYAPSVGPDRARLEAAHDTGGASISLVKTAAQTIFGDIRLGDRGARHACSLASREIFAPVLSFETFWTRRPIARRMSPNMVWRQRSHQRYRPRRPCRAPPQGGHGLDQRMGRTSDTVEEGGFKSSGIGRARGARAVEEFQEIKTHFLVYKV